MKLRSSLFALATAGALAASPVWADPGFRHGGGHYYGGGGYWAAPLAFVLGTAMLASALQPQYVTPVYTTPVMVPPAYPTTVVQPVVYTETVYAAPAIAPPPAGPVSASGTAWWYACRNPSGYYPYVKTCPSGWERVAPTPPDAPRP